MKTLLIILAALNYIFAGFNAGWALAGYMCRQSTSYMWLDISVICINLFAGVFATIEIHKVYD